MRMRLQMLWRVLSGEESVRLEHNSQRIARLEERVSALEAIRQVARDAER